ncbi:hypothetical protein HanPI659440_Chr16g0637021 [Helianthus annuus]|nr:hypothetical protein HanPI659440_Chr16g0637021 [Helianthus annuus]
MGSFEYPFYIANPSLINDRINFAIIDWGFTCHKFVIWTCFRFTLVSFLRETLSIHSSYHPPLIRLWFVVYR